MKAKYALLALLTTALFSCDDNTAGLGLGMFPGSDQSINGKLTTFDVTTESVHTGQIYAMSNVGYVGKFTDETFGTYQAGFLAELNFPKGMTFPGVYNGTAFDSNKKPTRIMVGEDANEEDKKDITFIKDSHNKVIGNIHTIEMYLWYNSYFGDSLTASRLSIYELNKNLEQKNAYYTDIKPEEYYDASKGLLGTKGYTAVDVSVSDSIRNLSTYVPSVHISFEDDAAKRIGAAIIQAANEAGTNFDNKVFRDIFKGIYVKSNYGDGTILYINQVQMNVVYKCYAVDSVTGLKLKKKVIDKGDKEAKDSTYFAYRMFNSTREVIQANQLLNDKEAIQNCINNKECTYLKSPAGIFTQITLPVSEIAEQLQGDTLNAVKLSIPIYNQTNDKKFGMEVPKSVLLIRKKNKDEFFKKNQLSDGVTSVLFDHSSYSTGFTEYTYNNITKLINHCLADGEREAAEKKLANGEKITLEITDAEGKTTNKTVDNIKDWEKYSDWNKVVLIPVLVTKDSSGNNGYYGQTSSQVISIQHDLKPSYARLKGGSNGTEAATEEERNKYKLKLEVISTNFGTRQNQ